MQIKDCLKTSCAFIGTLIGAGFATGQEVYIFFANCSPLIPLLSCVALGLFAFMFAELGRHTHGEYLPAIFPETHRIWQFCLDVCNFFVLAAMAAAAEATIEESLGIYGGGAMTILASYGVIKLGSERTKIAGLILVPAIVIMVFIIYSKVKPTEDWSGENKIFTAFTYPAMNILTSGMVLSGTNKCKTCKESVLIGTFIAIMMATLLLPVYFIVRHSNGTMPLLEATKKVNLGNIGTILIYGAIFSTCVGTISTFKQSSDVKMLAMLATACLVALFGFENIVAVAYPPMGIIGILLSVCICGYCIRMKVRFGNIMSRLPKPLKKTILRSLP